MVVASGPRGNFWFKDDNNIIRVFQNMLQVLYAQGGPVTLYGGVDLGQRFLR